MATAHQIAHYATMAAAAQALAAEAAAARPLWSDLPGIIRLDTMPAPRQRCVRPPEPEGSGIVIGVLIGLCLWALLAVVWVVLQ